MEWVYGVRLPAQGREPLCGSCGKQYLIEGERCFDVTRPKAVAAAKLA